MDRRTRLIEEYTHVAKSLVYKYNRFFDEDLYHDCIIKEIMAIDDGLSKNLSDSKIKYKVITYVTNHIFDHFKRKKLERRNEEMIEQDFNIVDVEMRASLDGKTLKVYEMIMDGCSDQEIENKLNIKSKMLYVYKKRIKEMLSI